MIIRGILSILLIWCIGYVLQRLRSAVLQNHTHTSSTITKREALDILGLQEDASPQEIRAAWKQKLAEHHPDHGGSSYFTQRINEARDILLKK